MLWPLMIIGMAVLATGFVVVAFTRWGTRWGATPDECAARMIGDAYLDGGPPARVAMTRAVSITAGPEAVWPWLAQLGRGAGWYSIDRLDNGGRASAEHIVSWIPEPRVGDAAAVGYLRHIEPGRELAWWMSGMRSLGVWLRMVMDIRLTTEGEGARLVIRMSGDGSGPAARPFLWLFQFIDTIMARRQLLGIKERVERYGVRAADIERPETGATDQYQLYEVIYASGERAGLAGREQALRWRESALADGVFEQ